MKHKPLSELMSIAELRPPARTSTISKRERLDRWAESQSCSLIPSSAGLASGGFRDKCRSEN
jgi:hypothetical protein